MDGLRTFPDPGIVENGVAKVKGGVRRLKVLLCHVTMDDLHVRGVLCRVKMLHLHMLVGDLQVPIRDC